MSKMKWLSARDLDEDRITEKRSGGAGVNKLNYKANGTSKFKSSSSSNPYKYHIDSLKSAEDYYRTDLTIDEIEEMKNKGRTSYYQEIKEAGKLSHDELIKTQLQMFDKINDENDDLLKHSLFLDDVLRTPMIPEFCNNITLTEFYGELWVEYDTNTTIKNDL